jgi:hypothetical protein
MDGNEELAVKQGQRVVVESDSSSWLLHRGVEHAPEEKGKKTTSSPGG